MSYRLKFDEPVDKGWRRIVHEQIATAIELLSTGADRATAIHETRKGMKRIRALLKLLRSGLSEADYKRENARFAGIARLLSDVRDAAVLIATATELSKSTSGKPRAAALALAEQARLNAQSRPRKSRTREGAAPDGVAQAIAALKRAAKAVDDLKLEQRSFSVVRRGVARSYRAGRRAMLRAYDTGDDEEFHEWRKHVQAHWRHMGLLSRAWPDLFAARMQLAKEMSDLLGADHDLFVLIEQARRGRRLDRSGVDGLIKAAEARQSELRAELHAKGAALFTEETDGFVARMEAYWAAAKASRKLARAAERAQRKSGKSASDGEPRRLPPQRAKVRTQA